MSRDVVAITVIPDAFQFDPVRALIDIPSIYIHLAHLSNLIFFAPYPPYVLSVYMTVVLCYS